jgi:hypothetical protein
VRRSRLRSSRARDGRVKSLVFCGTQLRLGLQIYSLSHVSDRAASNSPIGSKSWRGDKRHPRATTSANANRHRRWHSVFCIQPSAAGKQDWPSDCFAYCMSRFKKKNKGSRQRIIFSGKLCTNRLHDAEARLTGPMESLAYDVLSTCSSWLFSFPSARIGCGGHTESDICMRMPSLAWLAATQFVSAKI